MGAREAPPNRLPGGRPPRRQRASRLPRAVVGAGHEHRVDGVDDAVVALDVRRPVGRLGRALRLEADDGVVEPVLAELAVVGQRAAVERLLVRVEGVHRLLALDHVVLEHVSRDRRADLVVVLVEGRVGRREERVLTAREVDALLGERGRELVEVVVALDVGLVVAEEHAVRAPEDLRALHRGEGVGDGRVELRGGLGGRDGREGRDGRGEGEGEGELGHFCESCVQRHREWGARDPLCKCVVRGAARSRRRRCPTSGAAESARGPGVGRRHQVARLQTADAGKCRGFSRR
ncbi:unnamed protein product [Pelagomonas calceolata]|uniref:Uncharacterized protein n=1 Tax=Pelagomonas calceolata TaxID=35677 RepID=A0A8J2WHF7_9STRA|nr:unnamed protein product [Pelagomonas calceolata]